MGRRADRGRVPEDPDEARIVRPSAQGRSDLHRVVTRCGLTEDHARERTVVLEDDHRVLGAEAARSRIPVRVEGDARREQVVVDPLVVGADSCAERPVAVGQSDPTRQCRGSTPRQDPRCRRRRNRRWQRCSSQRRTSRQAGFQRLAGQVDASAHIKLLRLQLSTRGGCGRWRHGTGGSRAPGVATRLQAD